MTKASGNNQELVQTLGTRANHQEHAVSPAKTIEAYLKKMAPTFAQVLPKHINEDRLLRIALTTIRTNPKLLQCEVPSLMAAVMQSAQLGLEPGLLGHCYLIPFRNNKRNTMEVQFVIGYKGMIDLARRSGNIQSISAHEVYKNDFFELTYGLHEDLKHIPWHVRTDDEFTEPGELRGAYMVAHFMDGGHLVHYMPKHEIEIHRQKSKSANNGPWVSDYIEMCKKTVVRSGWKWLPISIEVAEQVVQADESTRKEVVTDEFIDIPVSDAQEVPSDVAQANAETAATNDDASGDLLFDESKLGF